MNDKAYYSLGIDIGSTTVKIAILNNDNEIMFAYENTENNRATYIFICYNEDILNTIKLISNYFSSGLINKRETISNNFSPSDNNINTMFKISHSDSNWKDRILTIRNEILSKAKL